MPDKGPLDLRSEVIHARAQYQRGEMSLDSLYAVVDQYIKAVTDRAATLSPKIRRRFRPPSRAYILRAL